MVRSQDELTKICGRYLWITLDGKFQRETDEWKELDRKRAYQHECLDKSSDFVKKGMLKEAREEFEKYYAIEKANTDLLQKLGLLKEE